MSFTKNGCASCDPSVSPQMGQLGSVIPPVDVLDTPELEAPTVDVDPIQQPAAMETTEQPAS